MLDFNFSFYLEQVQKLQQQQKASTICHFKSNKTQPSTDKQLPANKINAATAVAAAATATIVIVVGAAFV